ncbi:MAG: acyl-ACP--UDP-N-acetylglucosamine O-acyltransferase [Alphaproteobacteria bacterium]|nr:acyl-ACP--UDP-N-acetylglucosamine O-acyltransferase [Alphaproteobacteria bacterium]
MTIHPSAVIDPKAELGADVTIGPYCVIGSHVRLGDRVHLVAHVAIDGRTNIGAGTQIYPFACLGHRPQDLKYHDEPSTLEIGENNQIREYVTMNPGTEGGGMVTKVGNNGLFMIGVHVAHDCHVGNNVIMSNNATLAGHVHVEDYAIIGGLSAVHQFVRIGAHAMIGGMTGVGRDVIPYGIVRSGEGHLAGLNIIGLERRGFDRKEIHALRAAYKMLFGVSEGTIMERLNGVESNFKESSLVMDVVAFLRARDARPICQPLED